MAATVARVSFDKERKLAKSRLRRKYWGELDTLDDDARAARVAELNIHQSIDVLEQHLAIE
jgi:hypothetical protein